MTASDLFELLVGEIGIPRREFLYDVNFWETKRIIKGYRKRNRLTHQLLAEGIYATIFLMRSADGKTVKDLFPMLFEEDDEQDPPLSDDERKELENLMKEMNKRGGI